MRFLVALTLLLGVAASKVDDIEPQRPVWPAEYQISWEFALPYIDEYMPQKGGFKYKYQAWQDTRLGRQKIVRNAVETVLTLVPVNKMYEVFPAYDHLICWEDEIHGGTGPTMAGAQLEQPADAGPPQGGQAAASELRSQQRRRLLRQEAASSGGPFLFDWEKKSAKLLSFLLPDLSEERWRYVGTEVFKETGDSARVYEWDLTEGGVSEMKYRFFVTRDNVPLRLWMMGTNLYSGTRAAGRSQPAGRARTQRGGGHKDEYVATYSGYKPGPLDDADFRLPEGMAADDCVPPVPDEAQVAAAAAAAAAGGQAAPPGRHGTLRASFARHMPSVHWGHACYDAFVHRFGRRHREESEYHARKAVFAESRAFVEGWNARRAARLAAAANATAEGAAGVPHTVALNHLADWTREEYLAMVKPQRPGGRLLAALQAGVRVHQATTPPHMVPSQVIWKGTPADSPVKDQAACGSCWSFSTVGALEAAWYRMTGKQLLFSEQHMIDCSWTGGNRGCYGGDQIKALNWMLQRGGLATQADYPYEGVNDFCRQDAPQKSFKGHWVLVEGGEEALKEAVLTQGPMIVSVDASDDSFRFYSGGLYTQPTCHTDPADLDHAVIISGYGTTEDGENYYLVKNIWSPYWGEGGYMRVARSPNDCGIASEPIYIDLKA